jgi:hypothetical protein
VGDYIREGKLGRGGMMKFRQKKCKILMAVQCEKMSWALTIIGAVQFRSKGVPSQACKGSVPLALNWVPPSMYGKWD